MSGKVVHFEMPADDLERAQAFYSEVFGWKMQGLPGMGYTLVGTTPTDVRGMPVEPGSINGGMLKRQPPVQAPVITIHVADVDAALRTIEQHGGETVREKMKVGDTGFAAYFRDPEGNVLGLWEVARA
jgi:predicted enzyme related to lactoylglutathione lyase